jgi:hypothetical protein
MAMTMGSVDQAPFRLPDARRLSLEDLVQAVATLRGRFTVAGMSFVNRFARGKCP